jgi:hypothetical protein
MAKFGFQGFGIGKLAIELADKLFNMADTKEGKKLYRFVV